MRKLFLLLELATFTFIESKAQTTNPAPILPYKAAYSSSFEITNHKYTPIVATLWKDWDNNTIDNSANHFADTVILQHRNGSFKSGRNEFIAASKTERGTFKNVNSKLDAIFSFRSTDRNQDWVGVWGYEYTEDKNGKKDTSGIHEIWLFDDKGKVSFIRQYGRKAIQ